MSKKIHAKNEKQQLTDLNPDSAIEIMDQELKPNTQVKQAFNAEYVFRKAIEKAIPCGIAAVDRDGRQIYVNKVFCKMVGWNENDLLGTTYPFVYWPQKDIEDFPIDYHKLVMGNALSEDIELPFRCKNGERFWGLVSSAALFNSDGKKNGHLLSIMDITRRRTAENKLRILSTSLIDVQERERKRISQDLHDSIGGRLTGIKYGLEGISSNAENTRDSLNISLQEIISIVRNTIEETQKISKNLHPSVMDDLGLLAAIRELVQEYKTVFSHIKIDIQLKVLENEIPDSAKILIYRVVQEALTNVVKHSEADNVKLTLGTKKNKIYVKIKDNGKGFSLENTPKEENPLNGIGLASMWERTELFGGSLNINSVEGKGTIIEAFWPCET